DALPLLAACFNEIHVPTGVVKEARNLSLPDFILPHIVSHQGIDFVRAAQGRLHQGELETIYLGIELSADYVYWMIWWRVTKRPAWG
ncbi:MAG: hypothetical protein KJO08_08845, partial [Gammaproteobacteria bacterium]|nr:hypothetical protein [Gammaproteobacteria bacterium]